MAAEKLSRAQVSSVSIFCERGDVIDQAGAILLLLASAYEADSHGNHVAGTCGKDAADWAGLNPILFRDALRGVAALLGTARHLEAEERA